MCIKQPFPPVAWVAIGLVFGVILTRFGLLGLFPIIAGLCGLAYFRGYRIVLSKRNKEDR